VQVAGHTHRAEVRFPPADRDGPAGPESDAVWEGLLKIRPGGPPSRPGFAGPAETETTGTPRLNPAFANTGSLPRVSGSVMGTQNAPQTETKSRSALTYIVECVVCAQAWEVENSFVSSGGECIQIPDHEMLDLADGHPTGIPCRGRSTPGIGLGPRKDWEQRWTRRHGSRPRPEVFNGHGVRLEPE
jgi:hypothetical protein